MAWIGLGILVIIFTSFLWNKLWDYIFNREDKKYKKDQ